MTCLLEFFQFFLFLLYLALVNFTLDAKNLMSVKNEVQCASIENSFIFKILFSANH